MVRVGLHAGVIHGNSLPLALREKNAMLVECLASTGE